MKAARILLLTAFAAASCPPGAAENLRIALGEAALADGLWEVAASHFDDCLEDPALTQPDRARVMVKLAETHVRANQPAEALALLDETLAKQAPGADFWRAQAVAGTGRFSEAVDLLGTHLEREDALYRPEAAFTRANLQLALGQPEDALATLSSIQDGEAAADAQLRKVAILLDLGRHADAREAMPEIPAGQTSLHAFASLLQARIETIDGDPGKAAALYQKLLDNPTGQTLLHYHMAALGKAEALAARGDKAAAIAEVLSFITIAKENDWPLPLLPGMFERIVAWIPEQPDASDPLFTRLGEWNPLFVPPTTGLIATHGHGAAGSWPVESKSDDLQAYSMFVLAVAKSRTGAPGDRAEARLLLERLRLEFPGHPLANRALFRQAVMDLADGDSQRAAGKLSLLQELSGSPELRGQAAFLQASDAFQRGDLELARRAFEDAASDLAPPLTAAAWYNSAVSGFVGNQEATIPILGEKEVDPELAADLELERAMTLAEPAARRSAIEEFLGKHPGHPREAEARIAAAEAALTGPKPDLSFASAQLDTIAEDPAAGESLPANRVDWVRIRIADLSHDREKVITLARALLDQDPPPAEWPEATYLLGRNLFESRSYNDARLVVEKLAATDTNPARSQAAWLLAARSAALVGTTSSQQEALTLFDKAIEAEGPVSPVARLEKARLMIDMNRLAEATSFLGGWFAELEPDHPLHLPAGLLLGEAIYARGETDGESLDEALAVYDRLLPHATGQPSLLPRLQYLRGQVLEQLPSPDDPTGKRDRDAFIAYYSVLETDEQPSEWHYFELCGFKALALLEKAGRWPAAIACARRIASFDGPRAEEAAKRADDIQLKHMIWED